MTEELKMTAMDERDELCCVTCTQCKYKLLVYLSLFFSVSFYITFDILEMCGFFLLIQGQSFFRFYGLQKNV